MNTYHTFTFRTNASSVLTDVNVTSAFKRKAGGKADSTVKALWDTGSNYSCISQRLANALNLSLFGKTDVINSTGQTERDMYYVHIGIPGTSVLFYGMLVTAFSNQYINESDSFDIIIGMDIITRGDFAVTTYNMETMMSFCMPSRGHINFQD
ncbi:MAG: aspartyl protease family protein [Bacteroidota bacterium]